MKLDVRIGGSRSGEITTTEAQQSSSIGHLEINVKKATKKPDESEPISVESIQEILTIHFCGLRKAVVRNLAIITVAFMTVLEGMRSGNGKLTLASIARALPLAGAFKILYQRLRRFLRGQVSRSWCVNRGAFQNGSGEGP